MSVRVRPAALAQPVRKRGSMGERDNEIFFLLEEGNLIGSRSSAGVLKLIDTTPQVDALWWYGGKRQRTPTILKIGQASLIKIVSEDEAWGAAQKIE